MTFILFNVGTSSSLKHFCCWTPPTWFLESVVVDEFSFSSEKVDLDQGANLLNVVVVASLNFADGATYSSNVSQMNKYTTC